MVTAFIGPSGCGKSTFLRCLNRMNDTVTSARVRADRARRRGHLRPPRGPRCSSAPRSAWSSRSRTPSPSRSTTTWPTAQDPRPRPLARELDAIVEKSLRRARLGGDQGPLQSPGTGLSGGSSSALHRPRHRHRSRGAPDGRARLRARPIATAQIEELIDELRQNYAVGDRHPLHAAGRAVSQRTAFFHLGHLVEYGETGQIFTNPRTRARVLHLRPDRLSPSPRSADERARTSARPTTATSRRSRRAPQDGRARGGGDPRRRRRAGRARLEAPTASARATAPSTRSRSSSTTRSRAPSRSTRPWGRDLRVLLSVLRLAPRSRGWATTPRTSPSASPCWRSPAASTARTRASRMAREVQAMLRDTLDAFVRRDAAWRAT
jgi:phosphate transport system ATP-binding protein